MGENTKIEWATNTFNPWIGCTRVSPGCVNCYAEELMDHRYKRVKWGKGELRSRTSEANWKKPLAWNKKAEAEGTRPRVFCSSLADVFDPEVEQEWKDDLWRLIEKTPNLDWLLLTKRPEYIDVAIPTSWFQQWPQNVWLGVTVENQKMARERIHILASYPAPVRFLSCEPLIGPLSLDLEEIDWVIVGGESGKNARPMHPDWIERIQSDCNAEVTAFFFKQWGEWAPWHFVEEKEAMEFSAYETDRRINVSRCGKRNGGSPHIPGDYTMYRIGKKRAGRLFEKGSWDNLPTPQKREWSLDPEVEEILSMSKEEIRAELRKAVP